MEEPYHFEILPHDDQHVIEGDSLLDNYSNKRCVNPYCTKLVATSDVRQILYEPYCSRKSKEEDRQDGAEAVEDKRKVPKTLAYVTISQEYFDPVVVDPSESGTWE